MFEFLGDFFNYDDRKVEGTDVNGLTVSTVYTTDEGYETAIIDLKEIYPVERYENKDDAETGHWKWCEKAKTLSEIVCLEGFGGLVPEKTVTLVRRDD